MEKQTSRELFYLQKEDYDKKLKVNDEELLAYSKKKLMELYPDGEYTVVAETFESKKRDKENDIGRIELNEKRLYLSEPGKNGKLFRKQAAYLLVTDDKKKTKAESATSAAEVEKPEEPLKKAESEDAPEASKETKPTSLPTVIALLKIRLLPIILLGVLAVGLIAGGILFAVLSKPEPVDPNKIDPHITPVEPDILVISGTVTQSVGGEDKGIENAELSLQSGNVEIAHTTTDGEGKYLIANIKNGNYNLVCTKGDSVLTKIATVSNMSTVVNFRFPANDLSDIGEITGHDNPEDLPTVESTDHASDVKAILKITDDNTPSIAVGGLDKEAMLNMVAGKEVDFTLFATKLKDEDVPSEDKTAIDNISGDLKLNYYDFSVLKEVFLDKVLESSNKITKTKTVLEIAVPHDSAFAVGTYVFRNHSGEAIRLAELKQKPTDQFVDGTYYVTTSTVYIYTDSFSTYAIGSANVDRVVRGSDVITYRDEATVNLRTGEISMLYKHDGDSTNDARVEIYLGQNADLLISTSGIIPVNYQLENMTLLDNISGMPSVGIYSGVMRITYLGGEDAQANTQVEIPLTVILTR